jgi:hypothetical protein
MTATILEVKKVQKLTRSVAWGSALAFALTILGNWYDSICRRRKEDLHFKIKISHNSPTTTTAGTKIENTSMRIMRDSIDITTIKSR